jgi:hypothetical protein
VWQKPASSTSKDHKANEIIDRFTNPFERHEGKSGALVDP